VLWPTAPVLDHDPNVTPTGRKTSTASTRSTGRGPRSGTMTMIGRVSS
jgi:hypothetical protein